MLPPKGGILVPIKSDPSVATQKWVNNLSGSTQAITRGVQAVTQAPGQAAANQADKWIQRVQASAPKWKARVAAVSLSDWQQSMINVGIPRVAQGASAKQGKYQAFATQFFPHLQAGVDAIKQMPSTTLEQNIARATAMIVHNSKFKRAGN